MIWVIPLLIIALSGWIAIWLINMPGRYVIKRVGPCPVIEEF